jgi:Replication-relaxation
MSCPIAQPVAQPDVGRTPRPQAESRPGSTRKDCASAPSIHYITTARLDRIAADLSPLDWSLLNFVAASRLATSKQLVRRFWTDDARDSAKARAGRRMLKRLSDWRVLDPLPGRARGGVRGGSATLIYAVGIAGRKLLDRRGLQLRRLGAPSARRTDHTLACTEVVVELDLADARGDLDLIEVEQEPQSHRSFLGAWGSRLRVKPDLFVRVGIGALEDRGFIEVDLATEHQATLLAKAERYLAHYRSGSEQRDHGVYPRVVWSVPDARRAAQLSDVLRRLPAAMRRMFIVCRHTELVDRLADEARS